MNPRWSTLRSWIAISAACWMIGCGSDDPPAAAPDSGDAAPPETPDLSHTLDPVKLSAGQEVPRICQSWTLENETPLYVNKVVATNEGGLHHSNWIWVSDTSYPGPDGSWPCDERGFDQIVAGAAGGVFFAQSTQARTDTQAFPPGVAFQMPARVRIIGDVHLLNATNAEVSTRVRFDVFTIAAEEVRVQLQPMAFTNTTLDIRPAAETHAHMACQMPQPDFDIYYVLPHFHILGQAMQIDVVGGPMDGTPIFRSTGSHGEGRGKTFDPPIAVTGAVSLGITCEYQNPRQTSVGYGIGDQEMCVTLIYSSGRKAGGISTLNLGVTTDGGVYRTDASCLSVSPP